MREEGLLASVSNLVSEKFCSKWNISTFSKNNIYICTYICYHSLRIYLIINYCSQVAAWFKCWSTMNVALMYVKQQRAVVWAISEII